MFRTISNISFQNFTPLAGVRPVPLEIHVQGFDIVNLESRMQVGICEMHPPVFCNL